LDQAAQETGVPVIDVTAGFSMDATHFLDHIHLTETGAEELAGRLAEELLLRSSFFTES